MRKYSNFTKVKENSVARRTNFMFKTIELIQSPYVVKTLQIIFLKGLKSLGQF